jgi:hypothetical protein
MNDDATLLPSIGEINRRLTILARQQNRLRTLLRLAVEAREDAEEFGVATPAPQPEAARPEGVEQ